MALINGSVGNNMNNAEDDVLKVKGALSELGKYQEVDPHGYITREMDDSIKSYQRDSGLKEDGILYPGGETETAMVEDTGRRQTANPPASVKKDELGKDEAGKALKRTDNCKSLNLALENAKSILQERQTALNVLDNKLTPLEQGRADLEAKIEEAETAMPPIKNTLHVLGSATGALGAT